MRKALIFGLTLAAALSLAACGKKPQTDPLPDPAAVSAPADASAPTPPADPAPPVDAGPAPQELPGDGSNHDSPSADDESAAPGPAETEANPEEDQAEPADSQQPLPETGEEEPPAQQPEQTEEAPQQPDPGPAGSSDDKADGFAVSKEMMALIQAYLSGQQEGSQQSGADRDPTDFGLGSYQEYLDQIRNPEELKETAEKLFPGVSDYDIDWDAVWQAIEAGRSG